MIQRRISFFAQFARALGHNGALSAEEAASCSSLRAANALMRAHGINYNDALPGDQKWLSGKEGWVDTEDGGVVHTTASGRLTLTFCERSGVDTLEFESAETNDFGSRVVARLLLSYQGGRVTCFPDLVSNLLEGRPDRVALLKELDTTLELAASLQQLASQQACSRSKEASLLVAALEALDAREPAAVEY